MAFFGFSVADQERVILSKQSSRRSYVVPTVKEQVKKSVQSIKI
jgi:hypothetical protein